MKRRVVWRVLVPCALLLTCTFACCVNFVLLERCLSLDPWASSPVYAPDGDAFAFQCHCPTPSQILNDVLSDLGDSSYLFYWGYIPHATEICTVNIHGSQLTRLTNNQVEDGLPAWSPDGQTVAYLSRPAYTERLDTQLAVYAVGIEGAESMRISEGLSVRWEKLGWSPDGNTLSFAATDPLEPEQGLNLYAFDLEAGDLRALTSLPGDEMGARWAPQGSALAYLWSAEGWYRWGSTGSVALRLIQEGHDLVVIENFAIIDGLTWSPDGTHLAFWGSQAMDCTDGECTEAYVLDLLDGSVRSLTGQYEIVAVRETVWSPTNRRIAFTGRADRGSSLYTIAPDGGDLLRLTSPSIFRPRDLAWAPDGGSIAYVLGGEGEKNRIWFVDSGGSEPSQLQLHWWRSN